MGRKLLSPLDLGGNGIQNLLDPSLAQDGATKHYVDHQVGIGVNDPLFRWRRNYAKRYHRGVGVFTIGDSILFGDGGTISSPPWRAGYASTMQMQLTALLNGAPPLARKPDAEISLASYLPGYTGGYHVRTANMFDGNSPSSWATVAGSVTQIDRGMGGRSAQINASSRIAYTAQSANGFYWFFEDGASNSGAPAISIYGGDQASTRSSQYIDNFAQTMTPANAQYSTSVSAVDLPARGKWTIEFSPATGTPVLGGIYVLDQDYQQGVRVWNGCLGATTSGSWNAGNTQSNSALTAATVTGGLGWPVSLLVIYLGANDYGNNINPSTYQTNLLAIIDNYRAVFTPSPAVLLVSHFARYDVTSPTYPWSTYQIAMQNVKGLRSEVEYLDLSPYFPVSQATDTDDDLVDTSGVHFTQAGQAVAAQIIAQKLMAPYVFSV